MAKPSGFTPGDALFGGPAWSVSTFSYAPADLTAGTALATPSGTAAVVVVDDLLLGIGAAGTFFLYTDGTVMGFPFSAAGVQQFSPLGGFRMPAGGTPTLKTGGTVQVYVYGTYHEE